MVAMLTLRSLPLLSPSALCFTASISHLDFPRWDTRLPPCLSHCLLPCEPLSQPWKVSWMVSLIIQRGGEATCVYVMCARMHVRLCVMCKTMHRVCMHTCESVHTCHITHARSCACTSYAHVRWGMVRRKKPQEPHGQAEAKPV